MFLTQTQHTKFFTRCVKFIAVYAVVFSRMHCSVLQCVAVFTLVFFSSVYKYCIPDAIPSARRLCRAALICPLHYSMCCRAWQRVDFFPRRQTLGEASLPCNAHPRVEVCTVMQCVVLRCSVYTSLFISVHFFLISDARPSARRFYHVAFTRVFDMLGTNEIAEPIPARDVGVQRRWCVTCQGLD